MKNLTSNVKASTKDVRHTVDVKEKQIVVCRFGSKTRIRLEPTKDKFTKNKTL